MNEDAHVLVVDDDIGIQRALQRSLSAYGYEVNAVSTGEEALEVSTLFFEQTLRCHFDLLRSS